MKYPIGIQSFDQAFRKESVGLHAGALFLGAQGPVQGFEDRQPGKGLAGIPGVPY